MAGKFGDSQSNYWKQDNMVQVWKVTPPNTNDLLRKDRRQSRLVSVDSYGDLQTNERKCNKMLEDEIGESCSN